MAEVPKNYLEQIKELERKFTVDTAKLKEITEHFVSELTKGMNAPCNRDMNVVLIPNQVLPWREEALYVLLIYTRVYVLRTNLN